MENSTQNKTVNQIVKKSYFFLRLFDNTYNWKFSFIILCTCCFFQNLVISGTATVVLSTLEKEFFLTSTESGLFLGIFELAAFISSPLFGFLASFDKINKLKLVSLSLFSIALGSYLIGFTVFLKEPYLGFLDSKQANASVSNINLCIASQDVRLSSQDCEDFSNLLRYIKSTYDFSNQFNYMLYIGHFIIGFGSVVIYSVGVAYVEEITLKHQSPYCQAILYGTGSIGGGIGFLITGQFLNINARFYMKSYEPNGWIKPDNTYWIGAWWLPYVIYGSINAILFVLVFIFSFYSFDKNKNPSKTEQSSSSVENISGNFLREFLKKCAKILKNFKLMFIIFSTITEGIILKGFLGFMSKYIEYQFDMVASDATIAIGSIALVSVICGTLLSAFLINRFKMEAKQCSFFSFGIFFFTSFLFILLLNFCPETKFINDSNLFKCEECDCTNTFNPVCPPASFENAWKSNFFQSACHAGCQISSFTNKFSNCTCLEKNLDTNQTDLSLSVENCSKGIKCLDKLIINGVGAFLIVFFTAMSIIPHLKAALGCIEEESQPFALGVRSAFVVLMGNFVGTVLVGQAVDLTCKYWLQNCYNQKVCKLYNNRLMAVSLASIGCGCRFLSAIFMFFTCLLFLRESKLKPNKDNSNSLELKSVQ